MTKSYLYKPLYALLMAFVLLTSCTGQTSKHTDASHTLDTTSISKGQPKLIKTQGSTESDNVHCSIEDKAGNLWFGTTGEGVYRYDGKLFTQFTKTDGLNSNCIYAMLEDKAGNIWFGTENGVCRYDGKTFSNMPFTALFNNDLTHTPSPPSTSAKNEVWRILQDKTGTIWFGSSADLYCYDGKTFSRFLDKQNIINKQNLQLKWVQCLLEDSSGTIWMGSGPFAMEGVIRYDGQSITSNKPNGDGWIRNILLDKNDNIWFGGRANGNFIYDGKNFKKFTEKTNIGNPLLLDSAGNLWFNGEEKLSTVKNENGIWRYDGRAFQNYTLNEGISQYFVWNVLQDKNGYLWFGTRNNGLYRYDGKTFISFSE